MKLIKSNRRKAKIKMALQGPAGSGKTYSSLLIAEGLCSGDFSKVAVIDSENGSSNLYSDLGDYYVIALEKHNPEEYIKAIELCEREGMEVIIIDSITHAWEFLLDYHASLSGNSFTNWGKITPRQKAFIDKILNSTCHVIATMRTKQDYVLNQKDGKYVPEKVGLKAVQRDGVEYEFTVILDLDIKHFATCSKDRTGLFMDKPEFQITRGVGRKIKQWCEQGIDLNPMKDRITNCSSQEELNKLFHELADYRVELNDDFVKQQKTIKDNQMSNLKTFNSNGISKNEQ
ncbi:ATP-binding protein [Gramella jeungdoensis]|uniref:ATP-binding protein n=1 Tax=Gramella jeungdoensis TaxID=708091 RepID=A0ABT0Z1T3_9FLAO|nr:ATP-binding protein [Gramella jeungdoensis]MCM8569692.1 ATP-binding protein [Gramella jeungdoensis]